MVLMVRLCLLKQCSDLILNVIHRLLLDLKQGHAVILLDQHLRFGEQSRLSNKNRGVSRLLRGETFGLLLLFEATILPGLDHDKASILGSLFFIKWTLRRAHRLLILR